MSGKTLLTDQHLLVPVTLRVNYWEARQERCEKFREGASYPHHGENNGHQLDVHEDVWKHRKIC